MKGITSKAVAISIHAPRKAERLEYEVVGHGHFGISIHAPRKAERHIGGINADGITKFQSTLRARRSDFARLREWHKERDFNPRSAQGGATFSSPLDFASGDISIHAPRKAERQTAWIFQKCPLVFQSTLRARRSDQEILFFRFVFEDFNPRSAQGGATPYQD